MTGETQILREEVKLTTQQDADTIITLKKNQGNLDREVENYSAKEQAQVFKGLA